MVGFLISMIAGECAVYSIKDQKKVNMTAKNNLRYHDFQLTLVEMHKTSGNGA
jgi:hypothetical protein